jgi:hypothetical protein
LRKIYYRKIPTSSLCMYFSVKCTQSLSQMLLSLLSQSYGDRILGRNSDKSFKSFLPCYSQSPLQLCPEIYISTKSRNLLCISSNSRNLLCISALKLLYTLLQGLTLISGTQTGCRRLDSYIEQKKFLACGPKFFVEFSAPPEFSGGVTEKFFSTRWARTIDVPLTSACSTCQREKV